MNPMIRLMRIFPSIILNMVSICILSSAIVPWPTRLAAQSATAPRGPEPSADARAVEADKAKVAALDTQYQAAVKINDAATMDRILADDFILVTGSGKTYDKAALLEESRSGRIHYDHQEDTQQIVRIWGDTAVVTAKLWEAGTDSGTPFDKTVWFSDTYVRTPTGWRYVFGQSSLAPPKTTH